MSGVQSYVQHARNIDDYGRRYCPLDYLRRLPLDSLKLDRSFVMNVTTSPDDAAINSAIIAIARALKLKVVAEGMETEQQLAFLCRRGVMQIIIT